MTATRSHDEFTAVFRQEHREIRDVLLDLIDASRRDDLMEARRLVARLVMLAGPHFRYEEECLYPTLVEFFGPDYVENLCVEHDAAIGAARRLAELVGRQAASGADRERTQSLARGLLPHVSDCEGLSIFVERPPERDVERILERRRRARAQCLDLLRWADEARVRPSPA